MQVVMGYGGGAGMAISIFLVITFGYRNRSIATQRLQCGYGSLFAHYEAKDFWLVTGLNAKKLLLVFNDVDLCLKVRELGKRTDIAQRRYCIIMSRFHAGHEDTPKKLSALTLNLPICKLHGRDVIAADPAYNPNLTLKRENFAINVL
ncbi:hypothetical protein P4S68_04935 [Pseudoalteromonas sp. Hal099]